MTEPLLPAVEVDPEGPPGASVIWLHGLGADGHDFEPIVPGLRLPPEARVRFVFPHAPMRPVTINGGMVMRAWYDIKTLDLARHVDAKDMESSRQQLDAWVRHEVESGVPASRIVVAGFSQGGAIALYSGLQFEERLAGILALSSYHPLPDLVRDRGSEANRGISIFMGHGTYDPVVSIHLAESTVEVLRKNGYEPEWHTYSMPHSVCPEEVLDIGQWLRARLG